jgi:hypothetical protein
LPGAAATGVVAPGLRPRFFSVLPTPAKLQVPVVLLGDVQLLGRTVRMADRQLIGLARGDLGLVEIRNIHRDGVLRPRGSWTSK